jgi:hypothetical protein
MSLARVNGIEVMSLRLDLPQRGAWTAIAELDTGDAAAPTGAVSIVFDTATPATFVGAVVPPSAASNPSPGRARLFIRGGVAGMGASVEGKPYADVAPNLVVEDIVSAAGETLGTVAALGGLATRRLWLRPAGTASSALARFLAPAGLLWRMAPSGAVDIVAETWPAYSASPLVEREPDEQGRCLLALDSPDLLPGVSLFEKNVIRVVHIVSRNGTFRTEALLQ